MSESRAYKIGLRAYLSDYPKELSPLVRPESLDAAIRAIVEECAKTAENACLVPPDGGSPTEEERLVCEEAGRRIRSLLSRLNEPARKDKR